MGALWKNDGGGWTLAEPAGFPDEATLHSLVAQEPQVLPLAGSPRLVVLGTEVALGSGYADIVGIEPEGRLVVVEVKLARNAEARRAVVAQALAYAAYLYGLTQEDFERDVIGVHLRKAGHLSLEAAVVEGDQEGAFDSASFQEGLALSLSSGRVRLVFVLDEAPPTLVRLVGYLEAITDGLTIDLITVAVYDVAGAQVLVPQRVEPERLDSPPNASTATTTAPAAKGTVTDGADAFIAAIPAAKEADQPGLRRLADWAVSLAQEGVVRLYTFRGVTGVITLLPRLLNENVGLITIWTDVGPSISLWESVFQRRAPGSIPLISELSGLDPIGQGRVIKEPSDDLLAAITGAYREAAGSG